MDVKKPLVGGSSAKLRAVKPDRWNPSGRRMMRPE
jgi:hypothetical protein